LENELTWTLAHAYNRKLKKKNFFLK